MRPSEVPVGILFGKGGAVAARYALTSPMTCFSICRPGTDSGLRASSRRLETPMLEFPLALDWSSSGVCDDIPP